MALNDFLIGLQFRFGADAKSHNEIGKIKKGIGDITEAVANLSKIQENLLPSTGFSNISEQVSGLASTLGISEKGFMNFGSRISNAMSSAGEKAAELRNIFNGLKEDGNFKGISFEEFLKDTDAVKKAVGELSGEGGEFLSDDAIKKMSDAVKTAEENMGKFKDVIGKATENWEKHSSQIMFGVDSIGEITGKNEELKKSFAQTYAYEQMKGAVDAGTKALNTFIDKGVLSEEAAQDAASSYMEAFNALKLSMKPQDFEKLSESISGIDLSNMDPRNAKKVADLMAGLNEEIKRGDKANQTRIKNLTMEIEKATSGTNRLNEAWSNLTNTMRALVSGPLGQFTQAVGFYAIFSDALQAQEQAMKDITRLNLENASSIDEARGALRDYQNAMLDVGEATDVSLVRAQEQMQALAQMRLSQNVDELARLAETSIQAQYALGISADAAAGLAKDIMLIGGASEEGFHAAANEIAAVQDQMGLTAQGATEVASTVGVIIRQMNALGGSASNVEVVTREVAKMTSAFEQAGMSAQDASQMLNTLMDPQKLSDNTLLFHSMGMSAQEALAMMSGEGQNMEGMTERMVDVARRLKDQYGGNIYALQSMAEAHGMSLSQVQQLSTLTQDQLRTRQDEAALEEQAAEARASMNEQMSKLGAQLNILMQRVVLPMVGVFTRILEVINGMVTGFENFANKLGPVGGALKAMMGALLIGLLATKVSLVGGLLKGALRFGSALLSPIQSLKNGLGGIKDQISGIGSTIKDAWGSAFSGAAKAGETAVERVADTAADTAQNAGSQLTEITRLEPGEQQSPLIRGNAGASPAAAVSQMDESVPDTGKSAGFIDRFAEGLDKIDAKKIMQIGAALLMVAGAVALLAFSYKMLVDTVKESTPGELAGAFIILIGIMGALAGMALVLGKASQVAGPQIMKLGVSLLMVGAAAALILVSMSLLLETIKSMTGGEIIAGIIILGTTFLGLISILVVLAAIGPVVAAGILPLGGALMLVAVSALILAGAFYIISLAAQNFAEAIVTMGANIFIAALALPLLTAGLLGLGIVAVFVAAPLMFLGVALTLLGLGMTLAAQNINQFSVGLNNLFNVIKEMKGGILPLLGVMLALSIGFIGLGIAAKIAGPALLIAAGAFLIFGMALNVIGNGLSVVSVGFQNLFNVISSFDFEAISSGLFRLAVGIFALMAASALSFIPIMLLGGAMTILGVGMTLIAGTIDVITEKLKSFSDAVESVNFSSAILGFVGLAAASAVAFVPITLMGVAMTILGVGMTLVAASINTVSKGFMTLAETIDQINFWKLAGSILLLAGVSAVAFIPVMALGVAMFVLGVGMVLLAASINTVTEGMSLLAETIHEIDFIRLAGNLLALAGAALISFLPIMSLGSAMLILGIGMTLAAASIGTVAEGMSVLNDAMKDINFVKIAGGLIILGGAASMVMIPLMMLGSSMFMLGIGMRLVAQNILAVSEGFRTLADTVGQIPWGDLISGIFGLGMVALVAAPGLKILGETMKWLGLGLQMAAENLGIVSEGLKSFIQQLNEMPDAENIGLGKIANQLIKFGLFAMIAAPGISALGQAFVNIGNGIATINDEAGSAIEQLQSLKDFLMSEDLAGISQNFNNEMEKVNSSLSSLAGGGVAQAQARLEQNVTQQASVENRQEAPDQTAVVDQLSIANDHLSNIDKKIGKVVELMGSRQTNRTRNDSTEVSV